MNIYEFGVQENPSILMFHGSCMSWDMFKNDIDLLKDKYHIIIPALPGHDLSNNSNYTSVEEIANEIETWLLNKNIKKVYGIYGLSMGGSILIKLLSNNNIHFDKAIIDAGITPYSYPKAITRIIALKDLFTTELGKHSRKMLQIAFSPKKYSKDVIDSLQAVLKHMTATTIYDVFYSCNNYSVKSINPEFKTQIQYWYGSEEKKARKDDLKFVNKTFESVQFVEIKNMEHGEFATIYPNEFTEKFKIFFD